MTSDKDPKEARIAEFIDQNLKSVFSELESDDMPSQIVDLLSVLRAQDKQGKETK
ncbi:hypothetical protein V8J84_02225 [Yoonia sp. 208BN28-4]